MSITQDRLEESKCTNCDIYNAECPVCIRRYFTFLIRDGYVDRFKFEELERRCRAAEAMNRSYQVQIEHLTREE